MSVYNKQSKASTQPRLGVVFPLGAEYMHSGHCEMLWIKVFYNKYKLNYKKRLGASTRALIEAVK